MKTLIAILLSFVVHTSYANKNTTPVLVNTDILSDFGYTYNTSHSDVTTFHATEGELEHLLKHSHDYHRCGGLEVLDNQESPTSALTALNTQIYNNRILARQLLIQNQPIGFKETIADATQLLDKKNLRGTVEKLSSFRTRSSRSKTPNEHVEYMKSLVDHMITQSNIPMDATLIDHSRTKQKTLRVKIYGSERPSEIIVLGAHLDSTSRSAAPGADDNASGSANILEIFRVLSQQKQPKRSIEFFWYAAEERGLVGSAEIAKVYKANNVDVIAVLQLDMTGFPGSDVFTIANVTDYTSPWLQGVISDLNKHYAGAIMHNSKCGYGCSDHASWYRQGYPAAFPIEAKFRESNKSIHTAKDIISKLNFDHSLIFSKIGLSFAMELANSEQRSP